MKAIAVPLRHAQELRSGYRKLMLVDRQFPLGHLLVVMSRYENNEALALCVLRVTGCRPAVIPMWVWTVKVIQRFDEPISADCKDGIFDWEMPFSWISKQAHKLGCPGLADIWLAIHKGGQ